MKNHEIDSKRASELPGAGRSIAAISDPKENFDD
jgi:hypothetical protein